MQGLSPTAATQGSGTTQDKIDSPGRNRTARLLLAMFFIALGLTVPLPTAAATLLAEDFATPLDGSWLVVDEGTSSAPSDWRVTAGELTQNSNIYEDDFSPTVLRKVGTYLLYSPGGLWSDYSIDWMQRSEDNDALGVIFRYVDNDNYYRFSVDIQRSYRRLVKKEGGVYTLLAADAIPYIQGVDQTVRIEVAGSNIQVLVDGAPVFDVTDASLPAGSIAFYSWGNTGARFDNLLVDELILTPDVTEPAAVTDLAASLPTSSSLVVSWTATGDDGASGRAASYDLRYGAAPIVDEAAFAAATPVPSPPLPQVSGNSEQVTVSGLQPLTTYHFALQVSDESGNTSGLSNSASGSTTEQLPLVLSETFSSPLSSDWVVVDQGSTSAPSSWSVAGGELNQNSNIYEPDPSDASLPKEGTYLYYTPGFAWGDVTIQWRQRSLDDDSMGVMFRYTDDDNYYRFSVNLQRNYSRLVKKQGGVYTLLASSTASYVQNVDQDVRIEAIGSSLQVLVDGLPLFNVTDTALNTGTMAFYSWGNAGGRFDNLQVEETQATADIIAPAAVSTLTAGNPTFSSLDVTWTATGDDGFSGQASSYDLRQALAPITDEAAFAAATPVAGLPAPQAAGALESVIVNGLSPETTYHFALKVGDEVGNISGLSNSASATTSAAPTAELTFTNITSASGTGGPGTFGGHGIQFADLTDDGLPDMYVTMITNGTDTLPDIFYRNQAGTSFVDEAAARGIDSFDLGTHGAVWADLDDDGDLDLYNGSWEQNRIYRNDGGGNFTDMTAGSGLPARAWNTRGVAALDMDGDGDLDLFSVTGSQGSSASATERNEVYLNQGGFLFTSVDIGDPFTAPAGQGVTDTDLDGDGDMDLIAANSTGDINMLINQGGGLFTLASPATFNLAGVTADNAITAADVDNDGFLDLLIDRGLYLNQGNGTYAAGQSLGGSGYMGNFADLDNDGDLDAVVAGNGSVLINDGSGTFTEETSFTACGEPVFACDPRSIAFADIDADGDMDFFYANKATFNTLIRNNYSGSNNWLKVTLLRGSGQRGAFGARVHVYAAGQLGQDAGRIGWREARSQQGYLAQNDPVLHFGVGSATTVDVRVVFPGGQVVDLPAVATPANLQVTEPAGPPDTVPPDPVTDLAVGTATATTLEVTFVATGDDGGSGQASSYDLRRSAAPILNDTDFTAATPVPGLPLPQPAGSAESFTVSGLDPLTTYHFALKVRDEAGNASGLSNSPSGTTAAPPDLTAPAPVGDLAAGGATTSSLDLAWTATGDDATVGQATTYDLRYATAPIVTEAAFAAATPVAGLPAPQAAGSGELVTVGALLDDTTYYFALKVGDEAGNFSTLSNPASATTLNIPDVVAPDPVLDLAVGTATTTSLDLSWTASGDDGASGQATSYDLRYAAAAITDDLAFAAATPVPGLPAPQAAGLLEQFTVSGLLPATTYHFALKVNDEDGNISGISNSASGDTAEPSPILLQEDFSTPLSSDWQVTDEGSNSGPSAWIIQAGELTQNSNIHNGESNAALDKEGTYLHFLPSAAWTDYTVSWTQRSEDDDALGMMFRYVDSDNYYRFAVDEQRSYRRLVKKVGGVYSLLDGDTVPYVIGVDQDIRIEAAGPDLSVYVDGALVFQVSDSALPAGGIAFYSRGNNGARFDDLLVEQLILFPDETAPDPVLDLAVGVATFESLELSWTASGDDGASGTAFAYDLRYAATAITDDIAFAAATPVTGIPSPLAPGSPELITVSGLDPLTTYYFAVKVSDEAGNVSSLSNTESGATTAAPDLTPPAAIGTLAVSNATESSLDLSWLATGDDGSLGQATVYDLRYAASAILDEAAFLAATPVTGLPLPQAAGAAESVTVGGLLDGTTYYFALKAGDEAGNFSPLSNSPSGTTVVIPDVTAPDAVTDLGAGTPGPTSLDVSWTASGDDGSSGQASAYDLRYAASAILDEAAFLAATPVTGLPLPQTAGAAESVTVGGLLPATTYHFALKVIDGASNASSLSNGAVGTTTEPSAILLDEDFTGPLTADWLVVDEGTSNAPSDWRIAAGELTQNSNIYEDDFSDTVLIKEGTYLLYTPGASWTDYTIDWMQRSEDNDALGVMFRYVDNDNYYRLSMDVQRGYRRLVKKEAGAYTLLAGDATSYIQGVDQTVRIEAAGSDIKVYVQGSLVFDVTDSAFPGGGMAFYSWGNDGVRFDDLLVEELILAPDVTSPDPVASLAVGAATSSSLTLTWLASGDDGSVGRAFAYDLRVAGTPILNDAEFAAATPVPGTGLPQVAGATEQFVVTGLLPLTTYHFALKVSDESGNTSGLSNSDAGTTSQQLPLLLAETFAAPLSGDWQVVDEGAISAPSAWQVAGGELQQNSNIYTDDGSNVALPKPGTYLLYTPGAVWTDVNIQWQQRSDDDDGIGLMFRYVDDNNYYRYSVDLARGFRRLVKKEAGIFTELAGDTTTYVQGVDQILRIEATGNRLHLFVDGISVFDVLDSSFASGSLAFYSWGNNGVRFDDLAVEEQTLEVDVTDPDPVIDLGTGAATSATLEVNWTASGDDGSSGQAFSYDLRHAPAPILDDTDFAAATPVAGLPSPKPAGSPEQVIIGGLSAETTYHFALKVQDESGNTSALSNPAQGTTTPFELFLDTFDDPALPAWSFTDDSGTVGGPGAWSAPGGMLVQSSAIKFLDLDSGLPIGTYGVWTVGQAFSDYLASVRVLSPSGLPDDDRDIGMVFRYQNIDNFYRFSMDRARGRRLIARVEGAETVLAADTSTYALDTGHDIEILARGDRFLVRINGETILAAQDSRLISGTVGLYCTYNPGATFDDFLVAGLPSEAAMGLASPASFSLTESQQIDATALPLDETLIPAVRFTLDPGAGQSVVVDDLPPFAASFAGLATGEHTLVAEVFDPLSSLPVTCARCADVNATLGVSGTWITGFGDSIMRGEQDDLNVDDSSADDRNNVIGPRPLVNNWLTSWTGQPHTMTGEAFEAFGVFDASRVLDEVLARQPGSSLWVVLLGANDQGSRESGAGFWPGDPEYSSSFKEWMQRIIDDLLAANKEIIIGKVPFSNRPAANDARIQEYGVAVEELYAANGIPGTPPDFYTMVAADPATMLSPDGIHLSGEGYRQMARLIYEAVAERRIGAPAGPAPPTTGPEGGSVRLDWTAVGGADGYHVWRRADPAGLFQRLTVAALPGTTFLDTTVTPGVEYSYVVTAMAAGVEGPFSTEVVQTAP